MKHEWLIRWLSLQNNYKDNIWSHWLLYSGV